MLITRNGQIDAIPSTSMLKQGNEWKYLLVVKVPAETPTEEIAALFDTDSVEDDAIAVRWEYTSFVKVTEDENAKYVWLTYAVMNILAEEYEEALNILGVETREEQEPIAAEYTEAETNETN